MSAQMMRVISSPSSSTTGLATLILSILGVLRGGISLALLAGPKEGVKAAISRARKGGRDCVLGSANAVPKGPADAETFSRDPGTCERLADERQPDALRRRGQGQQAPSLVPRQHTSLRRRPAVVLAAQNGRQYGGSHPAQSQCRLHVSLGDDATAA